MARISTVPSPAASASAEPDMPENTSEPRMLTCASPPRQWPTMATAKSKIRWVIPLAFIRLPMTRNIGIAISVKLSRPKASRSATMENGTEASSTPTAATISSEAATGMPRQSSASRPTP